MTTLTITLPVLLRALCLPTFAREYAVVAAHAGVITKSGV